MDLVLANELNYPSGCQVLATAPETALLAAACLLVCLTGVRDPSHNRYRNASGGSQRFATARCFVSLPFGSPEVPRVSLKGERPCTSHSSSSRGCSSCQSWRAR